MTRRWAVMVCAAALGALVASCAKQMENQPPGQTDTTAHSDSARAAFYKLVAEKLPGIWVRKSDSVSVDEGFNLLADGRLVLIGATSNLSGVRWSLASDTLTLYMHAEPDTTPVPHVYFVKAIDDSALSIMAPGAPQGFNDNYRRRTTTVPKRYTEFFKKHFTGLIAPGQIYKHEFTVPTIFDGGVTLKSDSADVKFYLMRQGTNLTPDPVREWDGRLVPGRYTIRVMFIYQGLRKGANADYTVDVEER